MKLGLLTAAFPRLRLERVASWASENGFEMLGRLLASRGR